MIFFGSVPFIPMTIIIVKIIIIIASVIVNFIYTFFKKTLRLHPGGSYWPRVLTQEVVLSGYKVPPGVSKTVAQLHSV